MRRIAAIGLAILAWAPTARGTADPDVAKELRAALSEWTHGSKTAPYADALAAHCRSRRECLSLLAIAYWESGFSDFVLDFRCNDSAWRAKQKSEWLREKACDSGESVGPWQIHDLAFVGSSPDKQATKAVELFRDSPARWTVWRRGWAQQQVTAWMGAHP
jgi:hypothetical protein